jgi:hypothetical protein
VAGPRSRTQGKRDVASPLGVAFIAKFSMPFGLRLPVRRRDTNMFRSAGCGRVVNKEQILAEPAQSREIALALVMGLSDGTLGPRQRCQCNPTSETPILLYVISELAPQQESTLILYIGV